MAVSVVAPRNTSPVVYPQLNALVKPKPLLLNLLRCVGAEKDTFTMKEVIFYVGEYIMAKRLYDERQQFIVHCSNDPLGEVFGVQNFSVKERRQVYGMISKNVITVSSQEPDEVGSTIKDGSSLDSETIAKASQDKSAAVGSSCVPTTSSQGRTPSETEDGSSSDATEERQRKRHKSDSISVTFDDSLSWYVISGLPDNKSGSDSADSCSVQNLDSPYVSDSESDRFSVEFEVESLYSEEYDEDDEQELTDEDEVYQVTLFNSEDTDADSFDADTEISAADYWKCVECEEMNPPLPRHCHKCWALRKDWLSENTKLNKLKRLELEEVGFDVPDCKKAKLVEMKGCNADESQEIEDFSQPSTSGSNMSCSQEQLTEMKKEGVMEYSPPIIDLEHCLICQTGPKNGTIVHGRTAHLMACFTCAKKLKRRNKPCPVCRQPIQLVVKTFFS